MTRLAIGVVLVMILAFGGTHSVFAGQQQTSGEGFETSGAAATSDAMLGKNVQNQDGQDFGQVTALTKKDGEVTYILVGKDGNTKKLIPIPFSAAHFDPQRDAVILSHSIESELSQAPTLSIDEFQKLDDPEFEREVHSYYGQEPAPEKEPGSRKLPDPIGPRHR